LRHITLICLYFFCLTNLTACNNLRSDILQFYVEDPVLNVKQIALSRINSSKVHLALVMEVHNPNAHTISLSGFDYFVKFNQRQVFDGQNLEQSRLPPGGNQLMRLPIILQFSEARRLLRELDRDGQLQFEVKADIAVDNVAAHAIHISTTKKGALVLPHLPHPSLADIEVTEWGLDTAKLSIVLKISNPNEFPIHISEIGYRLDLAGQSWLNGHLKKPITLVPNQNTLANIDTEFHLDKLGEGLLGLIRNRDLNAFELDASLTLDNAFPSLQNLILPIQYQAR